MMYNMWLVWKSPQQAWIQDFLKGGGWRPGGGAKGGGGVIAPVGEKLLFEHYSAIRAGGGGVIYPVTHTPWIRHWSPESAFGRSPIGPIHSFHGEIVLPGCLGRGWRAWGRKGWTRAEPRASWRYPQGRRWRQGQDLHNQREVNIKLIQWETFRQAWTPRVGKYTCKGSKPVGYHALPPSSGSFN